MTASDQAGALVLAGRYRLEEIIGRGGMAEVYRALDLKLVRPVAVKLLLDSAGDEVDRARFISEARTLAKLSHSGLVTVLDAGFGPGTPAAATAVGEHERPFLVMELVDGATLGDVMREGPMPLHRLASVGLQIAEALSYVHARGVVHRDVKPGNVLLDAEERVKLADFGIARLVEQHTRHTRPGSAIGTAAYIAPEQVSGKDVSGAADIYALGLVLLEAIKNRREYAGAPAEAALARLQRAPEIPHDLPFGWRDLIARATALEPEQRPTAAELAILLRSQTHDALAAGPRLPPPAPVTGPQVAPGRTSVIDRSGDALARRVTHAASRLRGLRGAGTETWGVVGAFVALVVLLIALALARGGSETAEIPANTPDNLREPLTELHEAVGGQG